MHLTHANEYVMLFSRIYTKQLAKKSFYIKRDQLKTNEQNLLIKKHILEEWVLMVAKIGINIILL